SDATSTLDVTTATPEQPPQGLTLVHVVGTKYVDYFTDGTTVTSYPGDPAIDAHLSEKDSAVPTHEGLTWVHTVGEPLYDTPSGDLEQGDYTVDANGQYIANAPPFVSSTSTPPTAAPSSPPSSDNPDSSAASTSDTTGTPPTPSTNSGSSTTATTTQGGTF